MHILIGQIVQSKNSSNSDFQRFVIKAPRGIRSIITDSPSLNLDSNLDEDIIGKLICEVPHHDVICLVIDIDTAQSKRLDRLKNVIDGLLDSLNKEGIKFKDRLIIAINKINKIDVYEQEKSIRSWNHEKEIPTDDAIPYIKKLQDEIAKHFDIKPSRVVPCSGRHGYEMETLFNSFEQILKDSGIIFSDKPKCTVQRIQQFITLIDKCSEIIATKVIPCIAPEIKKQAPRIVVSTVVSIILSIFGIGHINPGSYFF